MSKKRNKEKVETQSLLIIGLLILSLLFAGMQTYALVQLEEKIEEVEQLATSNIIDIGTTSTTLETNNALPGMVGGC